MKVMVTGGTGFVGSHTAAELIRAGHGVKLLARVPERVHDALSPLGVRDLEAVAGDVTDPGSVERCMQGCDAVVHCASVYSLDSRAASSIELTNVRGTDVVLAGAHRLGLDPIVYVSSWVALIGQKGAVLTPDSPITRPPGAYYRSKADSDLVARRYRNIGAPVVITYPGMVWGPNDPHFGESSLFARNLLTGALPLLPSGGVPISDVRDLARLHAAVIEKGRGARSYMAPGHSVTTRQLVEAVSSATGRPIRVVAVPAWFLKMPMRAVDMAQRFLPFRLPWNYQGVYALGLQHRIDDSRTRSAFGITPTDLAETVADTLRWMTWMGGLSRRRAGRLSP